MNPLNRFVQQSHAAVSGAGIFRHDTVPRKFHSLDRFPGYDHSRITLFDSGGGGSLDLLICCLDQEIVDGPLI